MPEGLGGLLRLVKGGLDESRLKHVHDGRAHDREAVVTNTKRQVEKLAKDKVRSIHLSIHLSNHVMHQPIHLIVYVITRR